MNAKVRMISMYLFVSGIDESLAFYELLGLDVEKVSESFARVLSDGEIALELGTSDLTTSYDPRYDPPARTSKGTINFELGSAKAVDDKFKEFLDAGYSGHLEPIDALWQARFAIVVDPDGNQVGLHGPRNLKSYRQRKQGVA